MTAAEGAGYKSAQQDIVEQLIIGAGCRVIGFREADGLRAVLVGSKSPVSAKFVVTAPVVRVPLSLRRAHMLYSLWLLATYCLVLANMTELLELNCLALVVRVAVGNCRSCGASIERYARMLEFFACGTKPVFQEPQQPSGASQGSVMFHKPTFSPQV